MQGDFGKYRQTTDVGKFPPNTFGLYDMHGNVWEWCEDGWYEYKNNPPINGSAWINRGSIKMIRGGAWLTNAENCSCAYRNKEFFDKTSSDLGFRVVCS